MLERVWSMKYGTEATTFTMGNTSFRKINRFHEDRPDIVLKQYKIKIKINSLQDEMTEFLKFSDELRSLRAAGKLAVVKEDPATHPAFIFEYPKDYKGSHFIYKAYTIYA